MDDRYKTVSYELCAHNEKSYTHSAATASTTGTAVAGCRVDDDNNKNATFRFAHFNFMLESRELNTLENSVEIRNKYRNVHGARAYAMLVQFDSPTKTLHILSGTVSFFILFRFHLA